MPWKNSAGLLVLLSACIASSPAAEPERPPADKEPVLRIDPKGSAAFVTSLAFSPDGKTLYVGGWDKVVRAWTVDGENTFRLRDTFRVPVAPGLGGAIDAIAASVDGAWLAAAGNGATRNLAGFRERGIIVPSAGALDGVMLRDVGTIYLFNLRDRSVRILRGHRGPVAALAFGPLREKAPPLLLSVAREDSEGSGAEKRLSARLWDPEKGETISERKALPGTKLGSSRPGVAIRKSGAGAGDVQAVFALHDSKLRVWDTSQEEVRAAPDLRFNLSVASLAGRDRLLTAGADPERMQAQLALWSIGEKGTPRRTERADLGDGVARALALLSRRGDGVADLAAVVVWKIGRQGQPHEYRLRIVELNGEKFGDLVAEDLLWKDTEARQPVVAASLRGDYLAVAGNRDRAVRIYSLRPLLEGKKVRPQILAGEGLAFQHASFVRRGEELGLLLNPAPRKQGAAPGREQGDLIFDFGKRRLTDDVSGWDAARPAPGGWRAQSTEARGVEIRQGEKLVGKIILPEKREVSHYALLPPGKSIKVPLLAVASHVNGQPRLGVYNAQSGEQVREFTGHKERLRSLAFAPDGRLLVSTADDGTVCVWSLTDLDKVLKRRGRLSGVAVGPAAAGVKVLKVEDDSPAHSKLRSGEVLAGLVVEGKLRPIESPRAFYEAFYRLKPETPVVLRRGDPAGNDDVPFVVGQGIDERKPLFSLFVRRSEKAADGEWVGWSPVGPYESSSLKADKYLVWHFNTGDPRAPTRSAGADKYRKDFYREGLLSDLIRHGDPGRMGAIQLPPPEIGLWVEEKGRPLPRDGQAPVVARTPHVTVKLALRGRPLTSLTELTWRLDDGAETRLDLDRPDGASFPVPLTLARGEHRFVVTARTPGLPPQPTTESLTVRYQPPPPLVRYKDGDRQLFVRAADFVLRADVLAGVVGEDVRLTIRHQHGGAEVETNTQTLAAPKAGTDGAVRLEHRLKLRPRNNLVEVIAANAGAAGAGRETETSRLILQIFYVQKAKPPTIAFREVLPLNGGDAETALTLDSSRPLVVGTPEVSLTGTIKADEALAEAVRDRGTAEDVIRLDGFEAGKRGEFSFRERIPLEPGTQTIRFRARTTSSDEAERTLTVEYRPLVPSVLFTSPQGGEVLDGADETRAIEVRGRLELPRLARDYKVILFVNGKPAAQPPVLDDKAGTLSGTVLLQPGDNRIQAVASNRWGAVGYSEELSLRYVRPPVVRKLKYTVVKDKPLLDLEAEVFSPVPLLAESVRIAVNGRPTASDRVRIVPGEKNLWTVRLPGVPLEAGSREHEVLVRLSNVEAPCREAARLTVESAQVLSPPVVEFVEPRQDAVVSSGRVKVRFHIRSAGALERVRLLHEGQADQLIDLARVVRAEGGGHELTVTREIELQRGLNPLSVEAVSVSGRAPDSPRLILNYIPPPLRVAIDRLTFIGQAAEPLRPARNERGELVFPTATSGRVRLHGRILWADPSHGGRAEHFLLRVFVNGFQQLPVYLRRRTADEMETPFDTPLLLNRAAANHVRLVLPRQDAGDPADCRVDCAKPVGRQRLHVLALGARSRSDQARKQILQAIGSRPVEEGMQAPAFAEVHVSTPQTGVRLDRYFLFEQLVLLREQIRDRQMTSLRSRDVPMNDVLMIYYEGGEAVNDKGNFFETDAAVGTAKRFGMPCDELVEFLADIPGAHVLLLDVERTARPSGDRPRDKIARWKDDYPEAEAHVVVLRCARRGPATRPGEIRLMPMLQKAIPEAGRLNRVVSLVGEVVATSAERDPLLFTYYLPTELADLMIGPPP